MSCPKIYFKSKKCTNKNPPKNFIIFLGGLDKKKSYLNDIGVKGVFFGETDTMTRIWWKLEELESEAYLKIITGEEPIDYFDKFSAEWYKQGGDKIVEEVNKEVKSYKEQKNVSN